MEPMEIGLRDAEPMRKGPQECRTNEDRSTSGETHEERLPDVDPEHEGVADQRTGQPTNPGRMECSDHRTDLLSKMRVQRPTNGSTNEPVEGKRVWLTTNGPASEP